MEALGRVLKGDQVLMMPDHTARAAYEARMAATVAGTNAELPTAEPAASEPERETSAV
jgi:hypothetical protein